MKVSACMSSSTAVSTHCMQRVIHVFHLVSSLSSGYGRGGYGGYGGYQGYGYGGQQQQQYGNFGSRLSCCLIPSILLISYLAPIYSDLVKSDHLFGVPIVISVRSLGKLWVGLCEHSITFSICAGSSAYS